MRQRICFGLSKSRSNDLPQRVKDPGSALPPFIWTGGTSFPFSLPSGKYRLVVREFDTHASLEMDLPRIVFADTILREDIVAGVVTQLYET
jgi:hypothetical protein